MADTDEAHRRIIGGGAAGPPGKSRTGGAGGGGGGVDWGGAVGARAVTHWCDPAEGGTLLHLAALHGAHRCCAALLELGANVGAAAANGDTAVRPPLIFSLRVVWLGGWVAAAEGCCGGGCHVCCCRGGFSLRAF